MNSKKIFLKGINNDDAHVLVDTAEYLNALNIRFTTSENGKVGQVANVEGNVVKDQTVGGAFTLPAGTNQTIGAYEDTPNRRVFFFNKNSNGSHGIYCYDADTDLVYTVLLSSQVTGGLGFTNLIHSVAMIGSLLFWTDGAADQRRINVEAGIKLNHPSYTTTIAPYTSPIASSVITLIRNQPWAPLTVAKAAQAGLSNNFIKNESFQFLYRFVYRDNEISTFSPASKLINYNTALETIGGINCVDITVPASQVIEQDVKRVEIAVKFAVGGKVFIVKDFETGFAAHNAGTTLLSFRFFNDSIGIAVDDASAVKPFDAVPRKSKTLEIAKNRLFLGNNTSGYNTPTTTSLSVSVAAAGSPTVTGQWYKIIYRKNGIMYTRYYLYINDISTAPGPGYYVPQVQPLAPSFPGSVDFTTLTFAGGGISTIATYLAINPDDIFYLNYEGYTATITNASVSSVVGSLAFKSDATYRTGVVFFDQAGRKCGVVTNDSLKVTTPDRIYSTVSYVTQINWSLSNQNSSEIPTWATHYSVVRTKNQRTNFFAQLKADQLKYIRKDDTTGEYIIDNSYNASHFGVAIDVKSLFGIGYGYTYSEGDVIKLYPNTGGVISLAIKDTYSNFIVAENYDLSSVSNAIYEFYTPYFGSSFEAYYEVGETYKIDNPGTNTRKYSKITGSFRGDIYIIQRGTTPYLVEAMSPNDKQWKNWNTDAGRENYVFRGGETQLPVSVSWSNVIVEGSENNGLSTFEVLSQTTVPSDLKQISRLILTSKTQAEGTVMLAIGEQETATIYIGEAQIFDNRGSSFLATTSGVIGNVNVMRGSYGTIHPESAFKWSGNVVYFDANKGCWVRYDVNGLFPISQNKMSRYFKKSGIDILNYFKDASEYNYANPGLPMRVLGGVDPFHEEFILSMPKMFLNPKNTILEDMVMGSNSYSFTTVAPSMSASPGSLNFAYDFNTGPSASQTFSFTGTNLSANGTVTVTGSVDFEVSSDNITFSPSYTIPYTGTGSTGTVYVRFKSGRNVGSYGPQNITVSSSGATATVQASGTVAAVLIPIITTDIQVIGGLNYVEGSGPSAVAALFEIYASNLTPASGNITITPPSHFEISVTSAGSGFSSSALTLPYTANGTMANNAVFVRLKAGLNVAQYNNEIIVVSGGGAPSVNVSCSGYVSASGSTPIVYRYAPSGYGYSVSAACGMATANPVALFSLSDPSTFGVGSMVYTNAAGTTALTGYGNIFMNGANWDIDPSSGVVIAYSSIQC